MWLLCSIYWYVPDVSLDDQVINVCQDPMEIYSRLIHNHTIRGELVMDCFAGSGTCSVAALIAGRNVMAIEPDQRQIDGIAARLEDVQLQLQTADDDGKMIDVTPETLDGGQRAGAMMDKLSKKVQRKKKTVARSAQVKAKEQRKVDQAEKKKQKATDKDEEKKKKEEEKAKKDQQKKIDDEKKKADAQKKKDDELAAKQAKAAAKKPKSTPKTSPPTEPAATSPVTPNVGFQRKWSVMRSPNLYPLPRPKLQQLLSRLLVLPNHLPRLL